MVMSPTYMYVIMKNFKEFFADKTEDFIYPKMFMQSTASSTKE